MANGAGADPFGAPEDQSTPLATEGGDGAWAAFPPAGGDAAAAADPPAGGAKMTLDGGLDESTEVEDSEVPKGSMDIEGGGNLFSSSA